MPPPRGTPASLLITAGPTHEPIDEVRYIANRSSGKLGIALAEAAGERGHRVTLLLGPIAGPAPQAAPIRVLRFQTAADLEAMLRDHWPAHDVLIMAAAVCDFRPAAAIPGKMPRRSGRLILELDATPDLLAAAAAASRPDQVAIGFALEPRQRLDEPARAKLAAKGVAAIVVNPLETMGSDIIEAAVLLRDGRTLRPPAKALSKRDFARWLIGELDEIAARRSH
jgi:phosphopantothenoylcysteine decarboxylase/phosphopantothenate--cysteine ligase